MFNIISTGPKWMCWRGHTPPQRQESVSYLFQLLGAAGTPLLVATLFQSLPLSSRSLLLWSSVCLISLCLSLIRELVIAFIAHTEYLRWSPHLRLSNESQKQRSFLHIRWHWHVLAEHRQGRQEGDKWLKALYIFLASTVHNKVQRKREK